MAKHPSAMNMVLYVAVVILLVVLSVDSAKDCEASIAQPGPECKYESTHSGAPNQHIKYTVHAEIEICCDALECTVEHCEFHDIGCGHGVWVSKGLQWEVENKPIMRCHRESGQVNYSYTVATVI